MSVEMRSASLVGEARRAARKAALDAEAENAARLPPNPHKPPCRFTRPTEAVRKAIHEDNLVGEEEARILAEQMAADADGDGIITADEEAQMIASTEQLKVIEDTMKLIVIDVRAMAWCFRSFFLADCYWIPAWGEFQKSVLYEAVLFKEGLLLVTTCILCHIKRFFDEYTSMQFQGWRKRIDRVGKFGIELGKLLYLLSGWYLNLAEDLVKKEPLAKTCLESLIFEAKNYKKNMMTMKMRWTVSDATLCPLVFVDGVGSLAAPFAIEGGAKLTADYSKQVEATQPGQSAQIACQVLPNTLIPVLKRFAGRLKVLSDIFHHFGPRIKGLVLTPAELADEVQAQVPINKPAALRTALDVIQEDEVKDIPKMSEEEKQFLDDTRLFHYGEVCHKAPRCSLWCDELVALDVHINYDLEFVPAYKMQDKEYVESWLEAQKTVCGKQICDTIRDVTDNAEILSAIPR
eukprot:TRINITY_DN56279_c0_g1_i1.p1 TRINITY_DN56279_c0_g1~~TRINITY_DN56279_c0_g1_i1.p1  ORF type:complete len:505 (+),score=105.18 TRINITY_DN56279_c0_g1_i1:130-1515(+)